MTRQRLDSCASSAQANVRSRQEMRGAMASDIGVLGGGALEQAPSGAEAYAANCARSRLAGNALYQMRKNSRRRARQVQIR
jgi:hypothetical protein